MQIGGGQWRDLSIVELKWLGAETAVRISPNFLALSLRQRSVGNLLDPVKYVETVWETWGKS